MFIVPKICNQDVRNSTEEVTTSIQLIVCLHANAIQEHIKHKDPLFELARQPIALIYSPVLVDIWAMKMVVCYARESKRIGNSYYSLFLIDCRARNIVILRRSGESKKLHDVSVRLYEVMKINLILYSMLHFCAHGA